MIELAEWITGVLQEGGASAAGLLLAFWLWDRWQRRDRSKAHDDDDGEKRPPLVPLAPESSCEWTTGMREALYETRSHARWLRDAHDIRDAEGRPLWYRTPGISTAMSRLEAALTRLERRLDRDGGRA